MFLTPLHVLEQQCGLRSLFFPRWMYWSEFSTTIGNRPKIERAGMDGTHREVIVSTEMLWPKSITLDLVAKRLFWVDRLMHRIYSCDFDGGHRRLVLSDKNAVANSLFITTFEDAVYWTDMARSTVTKADKFDGSGVATVRQFNKVSIRKRLHFDHGSIEKSILFVDR